MIMLYVPFFYKNGIAQQNEQLVVGKSDSYNIGKSRQLSRHYRKVAKITGWNSIACLNAEQKAYIPWCMYHTVGCMLVLPKPAFMDAIMKQQVRNHYQGFR